MSTASFHMANALRSRGLLQVLKAKLQPPQTSVNSLLTHRALSQNLCCACCGYSKDLFPVRRGSTFTQSRALKQKMAEPEEKISSAPVSEADGWLTIGQYNVFAWSVSGLETCVVIKSEDINIVFDLGVAVPDSVKAKDVFISHGHIDHIGAVSSHVSKRGLFNMKPARYFVPPHLVDALMEATQAHYRMAETVDALQFVNVVPFEKDDTVRISQRFFMKTFPTCHRVTSQGYVLYKEQKKLKEEFRGMKGFEVAALHREGRDIHDIVVTPEIAYTGDTSFDVFLNPPTPDLLKVKLLITESTYLDTGNNMVEKARERGHIHLQEFAHNEHLFKDVANIVLIHFSNKYSPGYIQDCLRHSLPDSLKAKVTPGVVAMNTKPTTFSWR